MWCISGYGEADLASVTRVYGTMRSKNQGNPDIEVLYGEGKGNLHLHIQSKYEPMTPASVEHASLAEPRRHRGENLRFRCGS